jgi:hypothetical protein
VLQAIKKLDGLAALGERLAQGRLDRLEMERLSIEEQELARRAQELLAGKDADDAAVAQELGEMRAEQDRLAARLKQLAEKSELLQEAMAQAEQALAKRLAEEAGKLAQQEKSLMGAGRAGNGPEADKHETDAAKMLDETKKLADDALRLAQQATNPESKKMAQDAAHAAEEARKAMEQGLAAKAKGEPSAAKAMEAEALQKLEIARKNLDAVADKMAAPKMPAKADPQAEGPKTGEALAEGQKQVKMAQQKLQAQPGQAAKAMQQAAKALDKTARQMGQQMAQSVPKVAGRPSIGAAGGAPGGLPLSAAMAKKLEPFQGRSWGELPGELKTQLLQDARTYFGDDYAPIIQQYFEQITERRR